MDVLMQPWTGWQTGTVVVLAVVEVVRALRMGWRWQVQS
jgi:hypothetical protein